MQKVNANNSFFSIYFSRQAVSHKQMKTERLSFESLTDRYYQAVYWYIRRSVVDHDNAQDILQESFIKAYRHFWQLRDRLLAQVEARDILGRQDNLVTTFSAERRGLSVYGGSTRYVLVRLIWKFDTR